MKDNREIQNLIKATQALKRYQELQSPILMGHERRNAGAYAKPKRNFLGLENEFWIFLAGANALLLLSVYAMFRILHWFIF